MASSMLRERNVSVAGVTSIVREGGGDGPEAVVFVHGNPGSSRDWTALATAASAFARVVVPDMPGFGRADKPAGFEYTVDGYARHLAGLVEACGVRCAHLVLHDFGGTWGLAWAAAHAQAFRSVVLLDTGVLPNYRWHRFARIWQTPLVGEAFQLGTTRFLFASLLKAGNPRLPRAFVDAMYDDYDAGTRRAVLRLYRATPDLGAITRPIGAALGPLNRPALVVWGRHDPYIDVTYAARQRETFPAARVEVLPDCAHWPHAEDPAAVADLVVPFLRAQVTGACPA